MGQLFARETLDMSNLIRFLKKSVGKKLTAVLFATSCLFSLLKLSNMILPFFAEKFIDGVQRGLFESTYLFVAASLFVVSFVLQSIVSFIYGREQIKAKNVLQLHIMNSILHQNLFYIKSKCEGFFSNLLDNSIDTIMNVIAPYNIYTMFLIVQNVIIVVIMYCKSISAGILCTGLFLLHFLAYIMNSRLFSTVLADFIERTNSSMAVTYDFIRGNKSLVASENAISFANDTMKSILEKVRTIEFRLQFFFDLIFSTLNNVLQPCVHLILIACLGKSVISQGMTYGTFVLVLTFYAMFQSGLNSFQGIADMLFRAKGAVESLESFVSDDAKRERKRVDRSEKDFFFSVQNASLLAGGRAILKDSSFVLENGFHYALVGFSGMGKSSFASLLLGLRSSDSGTICFMNEKNNVNRVWTFENIAWLGQEPDIFNLSLEDNVFLGDCHEQAEYERFVTMLGLEKISTRLLGNGGSDISGGERQLVELARFLHQIQAKDFYFIDEPFVSLDSVTKSKVLGIVRKAVKGKTGICITHDDVVFENLCDIVIVYDSFGHVSLSDKKEGKPIQWYLK